MLDPRYRYLQGSYPSSVIQPFDVDGPPAAAVTAHAEMVDSPEAAEAKGLIPVDANAGLRDLGYSRKERRSFLARKRQEQKAQKR